MLIDIKNIYKIYNEGKESEVRALDGVSSKLTGGSSSPSSASPAQASPP